MCMGGVRIDLSRGGGHRPFYLYKRRHPSYMYDRAILTYSHNPPTLSPRRASSWWAWSGGAARHKGPGAAGGRRREGTTPPAPCGRGPGRPVSFCTCMYLWVGWDWAWLNRRKARSRHHHPPIKPNHKLPPTHTYLLRTPQQHAQRAERPVAHSRVHMPGQALPQPVDQPGGRDGVGRLFFLWMWVVGGDWDGG